MYSKASSIKGMTVGEYGRHAKSQKQVCDMLYEKHIKGALEEVLSCSSGKEIRVGDFGAADCVNSYDVYGKIMEKAKCKQGTQVIFSVVDLPGNDWETAANVFSSMGIPTVEAGGWLKQFYESRAEFVKHSFFGQCVEKGSLDIAFTSISTHWLSKASDLKIHGSVAHNAHPERISPEDKLRMKKRGMEDGVTFLVSRAKELKKDGCLLMGNTIQMDVQGVCKSTYQGMFETMNDVFLNWIAEGKIAQDQVDSFFLPAYVKTADEWKKCFEDPRVREEGLVLEMSEQLAMDNPYYREVYLNDPTENEEGLAKQFASEYVKSMLAFGKGPLINVLETEERLQEFSDDMVRAISIEPTKFKKDYFVEYVLAKKTI